MQPNEYDHGGERTVRATRSHGSANLFISERKVPLRKFPVKSGGKGDYQLFRGLVRMNDSLWKIIRQRKDVHSTKWLHTFCLIICRVPVASIRSMTEILMNEWERVKLITMRME